jgi:dTDP-3-amino-3,6-dideoxy-alpha-D-glucopyranose N,N-dimethyltransferase/dTDP-3-amino-3,4,6-trideoxy-alpha-D-glucopyranose N,N-dimethyltransferase
VGYLPDESGLERTVARMAEHLTPAGTLVVEPALTPDRLLPPETSRLRVDAEGGPGEEDWHMVRVTRAVHEHGTLVIAFDHELERGASIETFREEHRIRIFARSVYQRAFRRAGLEVGYDPDGPSGTGAFLGWMAGAG